MHDSILVQKLDELLKDGRETRRSLDHLDRLLARVYASQQNQAANIAERTVTPPKPNRLSRFLVWLGRMTAAIGLFSALVSFFPHVIVSDPVQMDTTDLFSYQLTVLNCGAFPLWGVQWALAPREIKMAREGPSTKHVEAILPHYADWVASPELMALATTPGKERHAMLMFYPGSWASVTGNADYEFQIRRPDNKIGELSPGDQFTFTTEGLISAPHDASYDVADFAVAIKYVSFLFPVQMQTCSHFRIYKDRQNVAHWFRAKDQCDQFPWMHNLFSKQQQKNGPAK